MSSDLDNNSLKNVGLFFAVTFLWSWSFWLFSVLNTAGVIAWPEAVVFYFGVAAVFGPIVGAIVLVARESGRPGVVELLKRAGNLKFNKKWLLPAFLFPFVTLGVAYLIVLGIEGAWPMQYALPAAGIIPQFFMIFFTNALPEEYGWRGYALDRLQAGLGKTRWPATLASLALGFLWGLWHLPLFFISGTVQENIPIYEFILQTIVLTFIMTWILNNNLDEKGRANVFLAILFHTISNMASAILPFWVSDLGRWIGFFIQLGTLVVILAIYGLKHMRKNAVETNSEP